MKNKSGSKQVASNDSSLKPNERQQYFMNNKETEYDVVEEEDSNNSSNLKEILNRDFGDDLSDDAPAAEDMAELVDIDRQPFWKTYLDEINKLRYLIGALVNNKNVQAFIVALIAINAIMMGIGTTDFVTQNETISNNFDITDRVFLYIFSFELIMQLIYHGWRIIFDGWLVFDATIVISSYIFDQFQIVRAFRIFRAFRLVTRIKVMKNLMLALIGVMPRMAAIGLLLLLVLFIFAVMFTKLFGDLHAQGKLSENYFGRMSETLFTLFQIMTMDNWAGIAREVMEVYAWAWLLFIIYVIITGFIVVNLIIAVICDAISALHDDDKAKLLGMYDETDAENNKGKDESQDSSDGNQMDTQEQMENLEQQIEELSRIQENTLQTLENLTKKMQMRKIKHLESDLLSNPEKPFS